MIWRWRCCARNVKIHSMKKCLIILSSDEHYHVYNTDKKGPFHSDHSDTTGIVNATIECDLWKKIIPNSNSNITPRNPNMSFILYVFLNLSWMDAAATEEVRPASFNIAATTNFDVAHYCWIQCRCCLISQLPPNLLPPNPLRLRRCRHRICYWWTRCPRILSN